MKIDNSQPFDSIFREITLEEYEGCKSASNKKFPYCPDEVVVVQELAFGCLGETSSKVSLWFDLPEPIVLTNQEIKRHKRTRQKKLLENNCRNAKLKPSPFPDSRIYSDAKESTNVSFESHCHKPFFHMRPFANDPAAFRLIKLMLKHRVSVLLLRKDHNSRTHLNIEARELIMKEEARLQVLFQNLMNNMNHWKWPVSKGREKISAETSIPPCNTKYEPSKTSHASCLWDSFLKSISSPQCDQKVIQNKEPERSRLPVFQKLSKGQSLEGEAGNKPFHIKSQSDEYGNIANDAWKTILGIESNGGWNLIQEHYLGPNDSKVQDKNMPLSPPHGEK